MMMKRREFLTGLTAIAGSYMLTGCGGDNGIGNVGSDLSSTAKASIPSVSPAGMAAVGVHTSGGDGSITGYDQFSQWLGKPVLYRNVFTARSSWNDVASPFFLGATKLWLDSDVRHVEVMSVPLLLPGDAGFSTITSGQRDSIFTTLANNINAIHHNKQIIIRLGWEHNGNWFPWSSLKDPAGYKAAFRHVVKVIRAVTPSVRFDWCTDFQSYSKFDWTSAYPGDDVVDVISMDVYDEYNSGWSDIVNGPNGVGLQALRNFAKAHGKPEAYPEWGCSTSSAGHGDSPAFIDNMYSWIAAGAPNVLYHSYFNTPACAPNAAIQGTGSGRVPNAAAEFKKLFSR
jgi:hypothetical protein